MAVKVKPLPETKFDITEDIDPAKFYTTIHTQQSTNFSNYITNLEISNCDNQFVPVETMTINIRFPADVYKDLIDTIPAQIGSTLSVKIHYLNLIFYESQFYLLNRPTFSYSTGWFYEITFTYKSLIPPPEKENTTSIKTPEEIITHNTNLITKAQEIILYVPSNLVSTISQNLKTELSKFKEEKSEDIKKFIITKDSKTQYQTAIENLLNFLTQERVKLVNFRSFEKDGIPTAELYIATNNQSTQQSFCTFQGLKYQISYKDSIFPISNLSLSDNLSSDWFLFKDNPVAQYIEIETVFIPHIKVGSLVNVSAPLFQNIKAIVACYSHSIIPNPKTRVKLLIWAFDK